MMFDRARKSESLEEAVPSRELDPTSFGEHSCFRMATDRSRCCQIYTTIKTKIEKNAGNDMLISLIVDTWYSTVHMNTGPETVDACLYYHAYDETGTISYHVAH